MWELCVSVPLMKQEDYDMDVYDAMAISRVLVIHLVGRKLICDGGIGRGYRDIWIPSKSEEEAEAMQTKAQVFLESLNITDACYSISKRDRDYWKVE